MDQQKAYSAREAYLLISNWDKACRKSTGNQREGLNQKMTSLTAEQNEILKEIATQPYNQDLMNKRQ